METSTVASCCTWTTSDPSKGCIPGESTLTRYGPGVTPGKTYKPAPLVTLSRVTLVAVLIRMTLAPGITALCESVIDPRTVLVEACGKAGPVRRKTRQT